MVMAPCYLGISQSGMMAKWLLASLGCLSLSGGNSVTSHKDIIIILFIMLRRLTVYLEIVKTTT